MKRAARPPGFTVRSSSRTARVAAAHDPFGPASLKCRILLELARLEFATTTQLAYWCRASIPGVSRAALTLAKLGHIELCSLPRPFIWYAAGPACWAVMAHACHRNTLEIVLDRQQGGFRFLQRVDLLRKGFNPARGEHAGVDAHGSMWLVLLDDSSMKCERIGRTWWRRHTPSPRHWPDPTGRCWGDVVQHYVVACTDTCRARRHRAWITTRDVPACVTEIQDPWLA